MQQSRWLAAVRPLALRTLASVLLFACHPASNREDGDGQIGSGAVDAEQTYADAWQGDTDAGGGQLHEDASSAQLPTDAAGERPTADAAESGAPAVIDDCTKSGLVWKSAKKTNYESYPAPGSDECVKYHGCDYLGQFQACRNTMPESWVKSHDIAAVFPLQGLELHRLCLRSGGKTIVVTAIDTCGDGDCGGCCTKNRGNADRLVDLEKYTNQRFGVADGNIEWADLGAADPGFDGCN